jgi:hypothetical protein
MDRQADEDEDAEMGGDKEVNHGLRHPDAEEVRGP